MDLIHLSRPDAACGKHARVCHKAPQHESSRRLTEMRGEDMEPEQTELGNEQDDE